MDECFRSRYDEGHKATMVHYGHRKGTMIQNPNPTLFSVSMNMVDG